jgi:hypothetical protein
MFTIKADTDLTSIGATYKLLKTKNEPSFMYLVIPLLLSIGYHSLRAMPNAIFK